MGHLRKCRPPSSGSPFLSVKWSGEQQPLWQRREAKRSLNAAIVIKPHLPRSPRVPMATPGFVYDNQKPYTKPSLPRKPQHMSGGLGTVFERQIFNHVGPGHGSRPTSMVANTVLI